MKKLGRKISKSATTIKAHTFCLCSTCGCWCSCYGEPENGYYNEQSRYYSSDTDSYYSRIN